MVGMVVAGWHEEVVEPQLDEVVQCDEEAVV